MCLQMLARIARHAGWQPAAAVGSILTVCATVRDVTPETKVVVKIVFLFFIITRYVRENASACANSRHQHRYRGLQCFCTTKARSANARALFSYEIVLQKHARAFSLLAFDGAKTWKITVQRFATFLHRQKPKRHAHARKFHSCQVDHQAH